jgi:hypothetical protein
MSAPTAERWGDNEPSLGTPQSPQPRLEHHMTQAGIRVVLDNAGLGEVRFSGGVPARSKKRPNQGPTFFVAGGGDKSKGSNVCL